MSVGLEGRQRAERVDMDGVSRVCHFPNGCCQERKTADENHVFQVRRPGNSSFILKTSLFVLLAMEKSLFSKGI